MSNVIERAITPVVEAFVRLGVDYFLTGSVISSHHGIPRSTVDVDVVAALRHDHVDALVAALVDAYYIDADAAHDAIKRHSMFDVIHLATMYKVDVYAMLGRFNRAVMARRRWEALADMDPQRTMAIATAEDVVLSKLRWFRDGGDVSERQWTDVIGVIRMQRALDLDYMRPWARDLAVEDLLDRALAEVAADPVP
jgi:hypothetical protein